MPPRGSRHPRREVRGAVLVVAPSLCEKGRVSRSDEEEAGSPQASGLRFSRSTKEERFGGGDEGINTESIVP